MTKTFLTSLLILTVICTSFKGMACSMCKLTINGKTYLGSNEDNWRTTARVWFEKGKEGKLGAVYVGYDTHPQGGMNEAGLAFDGLAIIPPPYKFYPRKKEIDHPTNFLKAILQSCSSIEEVKAFVSQYNRHKQFGAGEYLFADRQGNYLVMEPDTILVGKDDRYLIANFCPSKATIEEKRWFGRYSRGEDFLKNHPNDTSEGLIKALTDTMSECRERMGDGTLYSTIADLNDGTFTLYFYHDFSIEKKFVLKDELEKRDSTYMIADLFPPNKEYQQLLNYKTPQKNLSVLLFMYSAEIFLGLAAIYFLAFGIKNIKQKRNKYKPFLLSAWNGITAFYCLSLIRNESVYFFPAPYVDYKFSSINLLSYIPYLLPFLVIFLIFWAFKNQNYKRWSFITKAFLGLNILVFVALICLYGYWGFYEVF